MQKSRIIEISEHKYFGVLCLLIAIISCITFGCTNRHAVIAVTGTNIGVEISQNPANQTPQAKLGYQRSEVAIVPTNRSGGIHPGSKSGGENSATEGFINGAKDVANVLMELRYSNIFSFTNSGIYQRLAVGETAVQQSVLMFAKDSHGKIDDKTASAIRSLETIKSRNPEIRAEMKKITDFHRDNPDKQTVIENAIKESGYADWDAFIDNKPNEPSTETVEEIKKKLRTAGVIL